MTIERCRRDFPQLTQKRNGHSLVYLDSAATSLKPWPVIERVGHFLTYEVANVHRGAHHLANQATESYENARKTVAQFIGADPQEIVFTRGTTESINLVAQTWGASRLKPKSRIVITEMEHHSNIVPWQLLAQERDFLIDVIPVTDEGYLDLSKIDQIFSKPVDLLAVTLASNTLGTINDLKPWIQKTHEQGGWVLVDGAQAVANFAVDMKALNCDFFCFSGHKLFAPFGIGVLFGKKEHLENLPPYQGGGSMISEVTLQKTSFHDVPHKFEAGTPNVEGAIGLGTAIEYMQRYSWEEIHRHEQQLTKRALEELKELPGFSLMGPESDRVSLLSFNFKDLHPSDIAQILDQENIAVRSGHHCTQPLMKRFGVTGSLRASFSIYNNESDVQALVRSLKKALEMLS